MSFMMAFIPILCVSADTDPSLVQQTSQTTDQKGVEEKGSIVCSLIKQVMKVGAGTAIICIPSVMRIGAVAGSIIGQGVVAVVGVCLLISGLICAYNLIF